MPSSEPEDMDTHRKVKRGTTKCGWCLTGDHRKCRKSITYFGKTWHCSCQCGRTTTRTGRPRT